MADSLDRTKTILLDAEAMTVVRGEAAAHYPEECCGALFGRSIPEISRGPRPGPEVDEYMGARDVARPYREIVRAVPVLNEWGGDRAERYLIQAAVVRELEGGALRAGLDLVGFYHSHPDGAAIPSAFDLEVAWPWYSYLIVSVTAAGTGRVRGWRLRDDRGGFVEEMIRIVPAWHEEEICR
jgi:proteasome lid subunit RPN8/RPN11